VSAPQYPGSYPHELAGAAAPPPAPVSPRVIRLAREARRRSLGITREPLGFVMPPWRPAGAIVQLFTEANAANPGRDKSSDGTIGDARHAGGGPGTPSWAASDHNPWLVVAGVGVVRAGDVDTDGLNLVAAVEVARAKAAAGQLPQLVGGGYVILHGKITAPDFSGWRQYRGTDPHVTHAHFSTSTDPARFDARDPWGIFGPVTPPAPPPPPPPPRPPVWTGPDLRGRGPSLRGERGANGPRVAALQDGLARTFPAYRHAHGQLVADGWWGDITAAWLAEFGHRSGIPEADGANVGPKLALALWRAGVRP
jgi:hypothetical protein